MNNYAITFDIDWAPDFAIRNAAETLLENNVKCTWFVTHESPFVKELERHKELFELGIHPNFFPGSSHGNNEEEVMEHISRIVPGARTERSHILYQSTSLLGMMQRDYNIEIDCNLLLYLSPNIVPHRLYFRNNEKALTRIPYFWEDDLHMARPDAEWNSYDKVYHSKGLKIFNFHPIHTYLNSHSIDTYNEAKSKNQLQSFSEDELSKFINRDRKGINVFFKDLIQYFVENKIETYTISEIGQEFEKSNPAK